VVALIFYLVVLCAYASLCALAVVIPTHQSLPQEDLHFRRVSHVAAAAAATAVEETCPSPSSETVQVIQIAARAATAATATALRGDPTEPSHVPWASSMSDMTGQGAGGRAGSGRGQGGGAARGRGGAGQGRGGAGRGRGGSGRSWGVERARSGARRKPRTSVSLGDKLAIIDIKDAGHTWAQTPDMFQVNISMLAARDIYDKRDVYKRRAAVAEDLTSTRLRRSYFEQVSQGLWDSYKALQRVGTRHLPVSGSFLEALARRIARELGATGFRGSPHFIQNWAAHHNLRNVALWGQGVSADTETAAPHIAQIRAQLESYRADRVYDMDETGLFYRCIPNRAYVEAGHRRQALGTKAMKSKGRITLVLACNATGSNKIPVAMIGKAKQPKCLKAPHHACPLPYFSQQSAWMDGEVFKSWFDTFFFPLYGPALLSGWP